LLGRHRSLLVALCRRALGDPEAVEDVVQEAALQAMLNLDRLRQPGRFGPWLAGIGLNVARRSRRGSRADWSWEAVVGGRAGPEPVDAGPGPAELAEAADLAGRVRSAVADLPPGQRAAVLTVYLGGMTQARRRCCSGSKSAP
jgi:RNA polymerase sigma-70 factor (ECF subfamily)